MHNAQLSKKWSAFKEKKMNVYFCDTFLTVNIFIRNEWTLGLEPMTGSEAGDL